MVFQNMDLKEYNIICDIRMNQVESIFYGMYQLEYNMFRTYRLE